MTNEIIAPENRLMTMLKSEQVKERFIETVGNSGGSWITSIINAANTNPDIWECEPVSVITAGLNAATLHLSLDPSTGQAAILPFNTKKGKKAVFIPMVRGLKQLALRTNKYRYINATPVYSGAEIEEDPMSGIIYLRENFKTDVIGYYAAFELLSGYIATIYMTTEEITEHAKKYSPSYNKREKKFYPGSKWVSDFPTMAEKTVLRLLLLRDGLLDPGSRDILEKIDRADPSDEIEAGFIEGEYTEPDPEEKRKTDPDEILTQLYPSHVRAAPKVEAPAKVEHPYSPEALRDRIAEIAATKKDADFFEQMRQILAAQLTTLCDGDNTKRYELSKYLFGSSSTKDMHPTMVLAGLTWLGVTQFNQPPNEYAMKEAKSALTEALKDMGQLELIEETGE